MKLSTSSLLVSSLQLAVFVEAHLDSAYHARHAHVKRADATTTTGTPAPTTTGPPAQATYTTIPPLSEITFGMPTRAITAFVATHTPGETPPISGAPVLPTALSLAGYPPQDKIPPTEWMKELEGFYIPNISPTKDSTCADRGWWTCGGHTRSTGAYRVLPTKFDWGISFDDGPSPQSTILLNKLKQEKIHATFFVVEYMSGHEISVHTWSHNTLTKLTNEQIVAELGWTRKAIRDALGVTPTTMRPPQGDIDDRVRAISLAMGMVPIIWTSTPDGGKFDSNDWRVAGGLITGVQAYDIFNTILANGSTINTGFISLQHDLFEITVDLAVGYFLDTALNHTPKFNLQSIGECLDYPAGNLYRETTANKTFPYTNLTAGGVDIDGDGVVDLRSNGVKRSGSMVSVALVSLAITLVGFSLA
ncbi:chitin deacetylase [Pholiota molesta]|nr:chitin deacetylase [Pholiota molesta]